MTVQCYSSIQGLAMRATRINSCGVPVTGGGTDSVVSDGFVSIELSKQVETGTDYSKKNAQGKLCVSDRGPDQLKFYDIKASFCAVDPELFELAGGGRLIVDYAGKSVGFAVDRDIDSDGWALEVWTSIPGAACSGGEEEFVYWLLPWLKNGQIGDFKMEDQTMDFMITARSEYGTQWGRGPYEVVPGDGSNTPARLDSPGVLSTEHLYSRVTNIAPPTVACGYAA